MEPSRFATLLRTHRVDRGLSQDALAEAAAISSSAVGAYERGIHSALIAKRYRRLADALQLSGDARTQFETAGRRKPRSPSDHLTKVLGNLPTAATSFIGRERELEQLSAMLKRHRIVTLTGTGGIGKTRLALQAASMCATSYRHGVWVIDLSRITDEAHVVTQVATTLGIAASGADAAMDSFAMSLRGQSLLLIFDNCEHVIGTAGELIASIVRTCPQVAILATSRERLRLSGEAVLRVPTLPFPAPGPVSVAEAQTYPAVALFSDRASTITPDFALTESRLPAALEICRRLDGIPLALELAAARLATLGLAELRSQLNKRFELLSIGPRDLAPRQQTLLATLDWSFNLLDIHEQRLLCSLSIFAGSFTSASARDIFEATPESQPVDILLSSLVDKSLLSVEANEESDRFMMLESMREYARKKLQPKEVASLMHRYAGWVANFADECERTRFTISWDVWLPRAVREFDNTSAALAWALEARHDLQIAARIVAGLRGYWISIGRVAELEQLATRLLEDASVQADSWTLARLHLCRFNNIGEGTQVEAISTARTLFESIADTQGLILCHLYVASMYLDANYFEEATNEVALAIDAAATASIFRALPHIALLKAEICSAQGRNEEARLLRKSGNSRVHELRRRRPGDTSFDYGSRNRDVVRQQRGGGHDRKTTREQHRTSCTNVRKQYAVGSDFELDGIPHGDRSTRRSRSGDAFDFARPAVAVPKAARQSDCMSRCCRRRAWRRGSRRTALRLLAVTTFR